LAEKVVTVELDDAVAWITLQRPEALNAWNQPLADELLEAVRRVAADPQAGAVVIRGAGRAFSSGADLRAPREMKPDGRPDVEGRLRRRAHPIISEIRQMPKPVVAAVNGPAAGVGCSLALSCDMVVAAESALFMLAFVRIGLMPDGGALPLVLARVGMTRTVELALLGDKLGAREAAEIGLVNRCVADDELEPTVAELAARLAAGPALSHKAIKDAFNEVAFPNLADHLEQEAAVQQALADSPDYAEGVAAFRERREPSFGGREA